MGKKATTVELTGTSTPFTEWMRLQNEFQIKITEETLRYLRRLQGVAAPAAPGTVMQTGVSGETQARGNPGGSVEVSLEVKNRQQVHCVVAPSISPLVSASGMTWFPEIEPSPAFALLAPDETLDVIIKLPIPSKTPAGIYRGALILKGIRQGALPVAIQVGGKPLARQRGEAPKNKRRKGAR